ncbi:hypothetical protein ACFXJ8_00535 [Nonomuraea sp. NPDC059194]|uniref:hypothetical protein n=1 Tax=Nonomuraea sp. NPDC059194 TaxID=3346764 RepID=UPI0036BD40B0
MMAFVAADGANQGEVIEVVGQIYGVCAPGDHPELALEDEVLASERWRDVVRRYARALS